MYEVCTSSMVTSSSPDVPSKIRTLPSSWSDTTRSSGACPATTEVGAGRPANSTFTGCSPSS